MVKKTDDKDELWINRIESREKFLEDTASEGNWERYIREYNGNYSDVLQKTPQVLPLNLVYAFVRSKTPDLYLQDPYFEFTPKKETTIGAAKLKEIAVNEMWHRKKYKREIKKGIQDALIVGHAWYKVGYNANLGNLEELDTTEFNSDNEDYFLYRVNWRHVLFNAEAIDPPYDATWIAQKFFIPKEDAVKEYGEKAKRITAVKLSGNDKKEERNRRSVNNQHTGDVDYVELYECWDKVNGKVLIVSQQKGVGVLREDDWKYNKMQGFPFLFLNLSSVNDKPYGISDVGMGEAIVLEKIKMRNAFLEHLKRGNRQLVTSPDNLTPESKDAYKRGDDSALLEAEKPSEFYKLPYAEFQSDVYGLESRLDDDLSQVWGQRAPDRAGQARTQTRTKFELQKQGEATTTRLAEQQNVIQDLVEEAAEKLSSLLEQFATEPYYVQLTGKSIEEIAPLLAKRPSAVQPNAINSPNGFTLTSDDIKGSVDVRIKEGSAVPLDKASKMALLKDLAQTYIALKDRQPGPFLKALAAMLVEEAGLHELTKALEAEAQFIAQQQQQAQEQAEQQQQMLLGQKASEMQLKAEELANTREKTQSNTMVDLLGIIKDVQIQLAQINAKVGEKNKNERR